MGDATEFTATPATRRALATIAHTEITAVRVTTADGRSIDLPEQLTAVIAAAVHGAAAGQHVAVVSSEEELSPAQAARLLGLSRQYVDRLITEGVLPARRLPHSTHRKLRAGDVLALAAERQRRQRLITDMVDTLTDAGAHY